MGAPSHLQNGCHAIPTGKGHRSQQIKILKKGYKVTNVSAHAHTHTHKAKCYHEKKERKKVSRMAKGDKDKEKAAVSVSIMAWC